MANTLPTLMPGSGVPPTPGGGVGGTPDPEAVERGSEVGLEGDGRSEMGDGDGEWGEAESGKGGKRRGARKMERAKRE